MPDGVVSAPGATIYPRLEWSVSGLVGTIGVRIIRDSTGIEALARQTTGIAETPATSAQYVATLTAPTAGGEYTILWDNGSLTPGNSASEDLLVTSSSVAAATGVDLCSLADVKAYLQKTDTTFDSLLSTLITRASAVIENYAMREFSDKGTLTRTFQQDGSLVDLLPYDLRAATAVTLDPVGAATIITSTEYALRPLNQTMLGTYIQLRTSAYTSIYSERRSSFGSSEISITGSWGAATTPLPVVQACVVTVGLWFRREIAARGNAASDWDIDGVDLRPLSMPGAAQRLIDPYKRNVFA